MTKQAQVYSVWLVAMKLMRSPFFLHLISRFCIQTTKSVRIEWNTGHRRQTTTAYWMSIQNVNVDCAYAQQNFSIQCNQDTVWPFVQFVNGIKNAFSLHVFAKSMSARYLLIQKDRMFERKRDKYSIWPIRVRCDSISKIHFQPIHSNRSEWRATYKRVMRILYDGIRTQNSGWKSIGPFVTTITYSSHNTDTYTNTGTQSTTTIIRNYLRQISSTLTIAPIRLSKRLKLNSDNSNRKHNTFFRRTFFYNTQIFTAKNERHTIH